MHFIYLYIFIYLFITYHLYILITCQSFPLHVLCLWHIFYLYFYCIPVSILCIFHIHSITYCFSCSITSPFIYFGTFVYLLYFSCVHLSCLIISHILFISSISHSSTYHLIYFILIYCVHIPFSCYTFS